VPNLTLQINPESLNFLNQHQGKQLTLGQQVFIQNVKETHKRLSELKKQAFFEFTDSNEKEIGRGNLYAITPSLRENSQETISLEKLQTAFENELKVDNKEALSFILLCLVHPVWLLGSMPTIPCSVLVPTDYLCSNENQSETLTAIIDHNEHIHFQLNLSINAVRAEKYPRGIITIEFTIDNNPTRQIKLLPIHMYFDFPDENESNTFQQKLRKEFNTWVLDQDELAKIKTKLNQSTLMKLHQCVLPILFSLFISAIAMVSFAALNLSLISVFLLPPLGLALGLIIASLASGGAYLLRKREEKKLQRPIHLFNTKNQISSNPTLSGSTRTYQP
jgi:hypothetical protein